MQVLDVAIVGAGPAGLSAAINGASEGLNTLLLTGGDLGGQIARTSALENLAGFGHGPGIRLIETAANQAEDFGAQILPYRVERIYRNGSVYVSDTPEHSYISRTVILALGMEPRRVDIETVAPVLYLPSFERLARYESVAILGGGNSAGQAAVFLSHRVSAIHCRRPLRETMSEYLVSRIESAGIPVHVSRSPELNNCDCVAVFAGLAPATRGLELPPVLDSSGHVAHAQGRTEAPGLFVAGDVAAGNVRRVSVAIGTGAAAIANVHAYLNA